MSTMRGPQTGWRKRGQHPLLWARILVLNEKLVLEPTQRGARSGYRWSSTKTG